MEQVFTSLGNWHLPPVGLPPGEQEGGNGEHLSLRLAAQLLQLVLLEERSRRGLPVGLALEGGRLVIKPGAEGRDPLALLAQVVESWDPQPSDSMGRKLLREALEGKGLWSADLDPLLARLAREVKGLGPVAFLGRQDDWWPGTWDAALKGTPLPSWGWWAFRARASESGAVALQVPPATHGAQGLSLAGLFSARGIAWKRTWTSSRDEGLPELLAATLVASLQGSPEVWVWAELDQLDGWSQWVLERWLASPRDGLKIFPVSPAPFPSGSVVVGPDTPASPGRPEGWQELVESPRQWAKHWLEEGIPATARARALMSFCLEAELLRDPADRAILQLCLCRARLVEGNYAQALNRLPPGGEIPEDWEPWHNLLAARLHLKQGSRRPAKDLLQKDTPPGVATDLWRRERAIAAMDLAVALWDVDGLENLLAGQADLPEHLQGRYQGYMHLLRGQAEMAKDCFADTLENHPGGAYSRARLIFGLGHSLDRLHRFSESAEVYQQAQEAFAEAADPVMEGLACTRRGLVLRSLGDIAGAELEFRRAMALMVAHGGSEAVGLVRFNLAIILAENGDLAQARRLFNESLRMHQQENELTREWVDRFWLTLLLTWEHRWPEALEAIAEVDKQVKGSELRLSPELDCSYRYLQGLALARTHQKGRLERLLKKLEQSLSGAEDQPTVSALLEAEKHLLAGDPMQAEKQLAALDPENLEPHLFHHLFSLRARGAGAKVDQAFWRRWARSLQKTGDLWSMPDYLDCGGPEDLLPLDRRLLLGRLQQNRSAQSSPVRWWDSAPGRLWMDARRGKSLSLDLITEALQLDYLALMEGDKVLEEVGVAAAHETLPTSLAHLTWGVPQDLDEGRRDILRSLDPPGEEKRTAGKAPDWAKQAGLLGEDPVWLECLRRLAKVAPAEFPVLLLGEPGTGKERLARALHQLSGRHQEAFLAVNGASLGGELADAEIFGFRKGAFTGADRDKPGLVEVASRGTLFLDEVGELPAATQAKLLRFIQEGEFFRLGETALRYARPRIISATNRNIDRPEEPGGFRADLFHRLAGVTLRLPPLRKRRRDILPLFKTFLHRFTNGAPPIISPPVKSLLLTHPWPGNVRELEAAARRAALFCEGGELLCEHLDLPDSGRAMPRSTRSVLGREEVQAALEAHQQNLTRTAKTLGVSRNTLLRHMEKLGIPRRGRTGRPGGRSGRGGKARRDMIRSRSGDG